MADAIDSVSTLVSPRRSRGIVLGSLTLWHREMRRFFRQRHRVVSALITPIVLWLLLGSGLDHAFAVQHGPDGLARIGYRAYLFPGTLTMILLFTAIFSTITVIEDRQEGFLQSVLAAPVPRMAIVLGKVWGGTSIALVHGLVFLSLWPWVAPSPVGAATLACTAGTTLVVAIGLTAMGLCVAWPMDSATGFHAVMMLFLMPMWFLSGAMFPLTDAPPWLAVIMWCNPMTYGQAALSAALCHGDTGTPMAPWHAALATVGVSALMVMLATMLVVRSSGNSGT